MKVYKGYKLPTPAVDIKIFEFIPRTGKRGGQIDVSSCEWVGPLVYPQMFLGNIEPIDWNYPADEEDEHWDCCMDAGWGGRTSIRHPDKWICFCTGWQQMAGVWTWVILPPTSAIIENGGGVK